MKYSLLAAFAAFTAIHGESTAVDNSEECRCYEQYNECRGQPSPNMSLCASNYYGCTGIQTPSGPILPPVCPSLSAAPSTGTTVLATSSMESTTSSASPKETTASATKEHSAHECGKTCNDDSHKCQGKTAGCAPAPSATLGTGEPGRNSSSEAKPPVSGADTMQPWLAAMLLPLAALVF